MKKQTTKIVYRASRVNKTGKSRCDVTANLADDCKNGHHDFSLTCIGLDRRGSRWVERFGGCCHDKILKYFPDLKILADLHLSDYTGAPMYAIGNGYYLSHEPGKSESYRLESIKKYLRVSTEEAKSLIKSPDKLHFQYLLEQDFGILDRWQSEANQGIALLESLTGDKWEKPLDCNTKYVKLNEVNINKIQKRIKKGYYTPENIYKRAKKKSLEQYRSDVREKKASLEKSIEGLKLEYEVDLIYLKLKLSKNNDFNAQSPIYYSHSNTVVMNWQRNGNKWSEEDFFEYQILFNKSPILKEACVKLKFTG